MIRKNSEIFKSKACLAFGLFLMGLSISGAFAENVKVFLLGGQSNMVGLGQTSELPALLQQPQENVLFYYNGNSNLTTLRPGSGSSGGFGPEVTFGRDVAAKFSDKNVALIKHAVSGSNLFNDWDPNAAGNTYAAFRTTVADGLAAISAAGNEYDIVGMLWTQGERDARLGRTSEQYENDLEEFIGDIRTRYGENLPFYISRLSSNQTDLPAASLSEIRTAQLNVSAIDPYAKLFDTDSFSLRDDNLHFDTQGQMDLGSGFADEVEVIPEPSSSSLMLMFCLSRFRRLNRFFSGICVRKGD